MVENTRCIRCSKYINPKEELIWIIETVNWFHIIESNEDYKVYLCPKCHRRAIKDTLIKRITKYKILFYKKLIYIYHNYLKN